MIKNYFKIAWRSLIRHKTSTTINILGLSLGITACIAIYLVTSFDLSFDRFHPDGGRIYRIVGEAENDRGNKEFLNCPFSDVAGFQDQIPGFEAKAGFFDYDEEVSIPNGKVRKKFDNRIPGSHSASTIITWPSYFDVFKYHWLEGNEMALNDPFKVVLTESRAKKYFGDIPMHAMIGRTVIYHDSLQVSVAGIVKDWIGQTDFGYTDFISISTATHSFLRNQIPKEDWSSLRPHSSMAFVKLEQGTSASTINSRFEIFIRDHLKFQQPGTKFKMYLQPLTDIHFTKEFRQTDDGDVFRKAFMPTLYTLMGIALFILIIATMNFINLSTAQSIQRAKEIGIRKVLGSNKANITIQFLFETLLLTTLSVMLSILLVNPVLLLFKDYIPNGIQFHPFHSSTILFLLTIVFVTTLLGGFYPARVLASYLPALSLKGTAYQKGTKRTDLRKGLIVFQFTLSMIFIIAAIAMGKQMNFMKAADKGFNADAIITIDKWGDREGKLKLLAERIKHISGVDQVIWQCNPPMGFVQMTSTYKFKGREDIVVPAVLEEGDETYLPFYQMKLIAGRNMVHSDSVNELIINETLARKIGFDDPADAVGKQLSTMSPNNAKSFPIVGVIADFHQGSFHDVIQPAVIANVYNFRHSVAIKLSSSEKSAEQVKSVLSAVETEWKKLFPETNFNYIFLNESIGFLYGQDVKTAWLVNVAMAITIFISCMGLFGLGMFMAERRTKEIGIRKVLGASVKNIATMLSRDFTRLIFVSIVIASPVAYYLMDYWLQDYAYRTSLSWWIFATAGASAIVIGLLTISFQALRAAVANPVESLRIE